MTMFHKSHHFLNKMYFSDAKAKLGQEAKAKQGQEANAKQGQEANANQSNNGALYVAVPITAIVLIVILTTGLYVHFSRKRKGMSLSQVDNGYKPILKQQPAIATQVSYNGDFETAEEPRVTVSVISA